MSYDSIVDMFKKSRKFYLDTIFKYRDCDEELVTGKTYYLDKKDVELYVWTYKQESENPDGRFGEEIRPYTLVSINQDLDYVIISDHVTNYIMSCDDFNNCDMTPEQDKSFEMVFNQYMTQSANEGIWQRQITDTVLSTDVFKLFPDNSSLVNISKHPGSNPGVTIHDIVHPLHYLQTWEPTRFAQQQVCPFNTSSYKTQHLRESLIKESTDSMNDEELKNSELNEESTDSMNDEKLENFELNEESTDSINDTNFFGRKFIDTPDMWIPHRLIKSTVNNCYLFDSVTPILNITMKPILEKVFNTLLPEFNNAWSYCQAIKSEPESSRQFYSNETELLNAKDIYDNLKSVRSLPDTLRTYIKIVDTELDVSAIHSGVWHLEGLPQEHIIMTGIFYLPCPLKSQIWYKRHYLDSEKDAMIHSAGQHDKYAPNMNCLDFPIGKVTIPADMNSILVFPNGHIHQVLPCINTTNESVHRRAVIFFLVDPDIQLSDWSSLKANFTGTNEEFHLAYKATDTQIKENMNARMKQKQSLEPLEISFCEH